MLQRHFIDWNQPLLPAVADYLIQRYATSDGLDLRNVVMVFTGRRASRRMLELLFEKAAPQWPAFIPPQMETFHHFPEMLYQPQARFAEDLTQLLIWKKAVTAIPAKDLAAALPSLPDPDALPAWLALCETLRRQHNELAEEGLEFDEVATALREMDNRQEAERWDALRRIQAEYLVQMDALGLWDRQASRLIAVQKHECEVDFDIILVGTVDMNRVVQQMLQQVADRVTAIIHAPESEAAGFDAFGCLQLDHWTERRLDIDLQSTRIVNKPEEQATMVVKELAAFGAAWRADEITIGVADDALVPAVLQRLADAGVAGRWPVGMQLKDSRPWRLMNGIVQHLSSARNGQPPDFASLSHLLRHPDMATWVERHLQTALGDKRVQDLDWLTELDLYLAQHLQSSPGVLLGSKIQREIVGALITAVDLLLAALTESSEQNQDTQAALQAGRKARSFGRAVTVSGQRQLTFDDQAALPESVHSQLQAQRPLHHWAAGVLQLLNAVYGGMPLQPDSAKDQGIADCCERLADAAAVLNRVPADVMLHCTAAQAIQFLLQETGEDAVRAAADDQAIDLLGWLELAMDDTPVLLLTGFNEGFVPESTSSDVFLPNSLRMKLGLRDNRRRYARDAYALSAMQHSRQRIVFIAGRADASGNPLTPSRLWFAADPQSLPQRVQQFYGEEADADDCSVSDLSLNGDVVDDATGLPQASSANRLSGFTVPRPVRVPPAPAEISVTAFRDYLACPYRYFLRRELKLRAVNDKTLELEAPAFGSLIHDVLNQFGESAYTEATTVEPIEEFLLQAAKQLAYKKYGRTHSATVAVQLQMVENRLSAFARWQAQTAAEGWRIRHTEESLKYENFRDAHGRQVVLSGRVDRIDFNKFTNSWRVLDYKTSEKADKPEVTHFKKGEWVDLQLPLYRLLVRCLETGDPVQLGYVHLPGNLSQVGVSIANWSEVELQTAEEAAQRIAADILDLKIDRVEAGQENRATEFARVCQDSVIDRHIPWLADWSGR